MVYVINLILGFIALNILYGLYKKIFGHLNEFDLINAARKGQIDKIQKCLSKDIDIDSTGLMGVTALSEAVFWGSFESVKFLVENGADINSIEDKGVTPFLNACLAKHNEIAIYLLENGADYSLGDMDGVQFDELVANGGLIHESILEKIESLSGGNTVESINFRNNQNIESDEQKVPHQENWIKQKMFSRAFSFQGRIRRTEFNLSLIIMCLLFLILQKLSEFELVEYAMFPIGWFMLAQAAKRCHDRGNSGWLQYLPWYIFWMMFAKGEDFENEYGKNPRG